MQFSKLAAALPLLTLGAAHPVEKRSLSAMDESVLQLALFLEHLEQNLYNGAYEKFTDADFTNEGFPAGYHENVGVIGSHETIHVNTITQILQENGVAPIPPCTYSFPYTDAKTFASLSNMITTVGVGAYSGGAMDLVDNAALLTAAATILPIEARHDAYLRTGQGASPFPSPFDTPLTALWAYNLAHMFIVECPMELPGVVLLPQLKLVSPTPPANLQPPTPAGTTLTFNWNPSQYFVPVDPNAPLYIAFINQDTPPVFEEVQSCGSGCGTVPSPNATGVAFAVLTTFASGLTELDLSQYGTLAGPAEVVLG